MAIHRYSFYLEEEDYKKLKSLLSLESWTVSAWIRKIMKERIEKK